MVVEHLVHAKSGILLKDADQQICTFKRYLWHIVNIAQKNAAIIKRHNYQIRVQLNCKSHRLSFKIMLSVI